MEKLIDIIKEALADGATAEQKAAAAQACRTVAAALDAKPGEPIAAPPSGDAAPPPAPPTVAPLAVLGKLSPDQALDLLIAKLRAAVPAQTEPARTRGFKVQLVQVPAGARRVS